MTRDVQPPNPYRSPLANLTQGLPRNRPQGSRSGLGIASFVIGIAAWLLEFTTVWLTFSDKMAATPFAGFGILGGLVLSLVGGAMALGGLSQRDRGKAYPVLGLALNALVILVMCGLTVVNSL